MFAGQAVNICGHIGACAKVFCLVGKLPLKIVFFGVKYEQMAKIPFWQSVQNNRLLQPFQVRDVSGRTLFDRARWLLVFVVLALVAQYLLSSRQIHLLINRDELERVENEFVTQFYPAYDSLYFWLDYQGNLATRVVSEVTSETDGEQFVASLTPTLKQLPALKYLQFGRVGVNNQWLARPTRDEDTGDVTWQLETGVDQDFVAWLLTQELPPDQIYWYAAKPEKSREIALFWLTQDDSGEKVYFLAAIDFPGEFTALRPHQKQIGAITFASSHATHQLYFWDLTMSLQASLEAELLPLDGENIPGGLLAERRGRFLDNHLWQTYLETGRDIFPYQLDRQTYWVKISPAVTRTEYNLLAIIVPEVEPFGFWGIRTSWITWVLLIFIAANLLTFFYYYARYSKRFYFTNQIKDIIKNGENAGLEFKSTLRFDLNQKQLNKNLEHAILKSVAAFNNTDGGLLIIGVSDDARVLGLENDYTTLKKPDKDGFELHLRAMISQAYGQHFAARRIEIFFPVLENKEVCVVKVKKGHSALYTNITDKNGVKQEKFYIRLGNSSREIEKLSDIVDYQNQRFKLRLPKWGKK